MCGKRGFLRVAHVLQQRARGPDGQRQLVRAEAPEVQGTELIGQQVRCARQLEVPGRPAAQRRALAHQLRACALRQQQLRGLESFQLGGERHRAFTLQHREASGREIQPREPEARLLTQERRHERVGALFQQRASR